MHALKNPLSFRPASRPSSPAPPSRPDSGIGFERSRPLNKLSLNGFRRPSPAPAPQSLPAPLTLVQDGSYLEMLSLKLSEAVSKALVQPSGSPATNDTVAGKRPIPNGRGRAVGVLIASELKAANGNPHLQRAILRSLHRPLSVLLGNLSTLVMPLLSSPAFRTPPAPTPQSPNPNATQLHALAVAHFAGELLETFDELALGYDNDARGDGLKAVRDGLVSLVNRVVNPLIGGIRNEVFPLLDALEIPSSTSSAKGTSGAKNTMVHSSIVTLQSTMPVYAQALRRYTVSQTSQSMLATFVISLIWRGLLALSHRPYVPLSPPSSPGLLPAVPLKKRRGSPSSTPPLTPPASRFTIKLPSSRPPSPQNTPLFSSSVAADARALGDLLGSLPLPSNDSDTTRLASEAVQEALSGLHALANLYDAAPHLLKATPDRSVDDQAHELENLTEKIPTLVALPLLLQVQGGSEGVSVPAVLGLSEDEYRNGCLTGFGRADECALPVGLRVCEYIRRSSVTKSVLLTWLEMEIADP